MGQTQSHILSSTFSDDKSVLLPVPSDDFSESLQSVMIAFPDPSTPSGNSDTYTTSRFLFETDLVDQMSDCWNSYYPQQFQLNKSPEMGHTIHRISTPKCKNDWISIFGTQIIRNGDYKTWNLKIYPRCDAINYIIKHREFPIADLVVGVVDADSVSIDESGLHNAYEGGFWMEPYFGYGYYGFNGKQFHKKRRGNAYGKRFKVGDVITIELDLIQCNTLTFYVNDVANETIKVDGDRNYVLAVALVNSNYDIQIRS